ncbi:hypothetical protein ACFLYU_04365 [Candidatus Dependentiae bacterium]
MKKNKLFMTLFMFLSVSIPLFCMQTKKQTKFIFNPENYPESKKSENNKFFVGAVWDRQKRVNSEIHIISLPQKKLLWRIAFGYSLSYFFCSPSGRYILLSSYHETNPKTQLWDVKTKKCILREEKKLVSRVFWGKSEQYVGLKIPHKKYYSDGSCREIKDHTLIFDTINKKYVAAYKMDCVNHFLDYPKNFLFFSTNVGPEKKNVDKEKELEIIVNMNTGKEFGKLKSTKNHFENWFNNKSAKILYLKRPKEKISYTSFVLVGGKKMKDNLYTVQKQKKFQDLCIILQKS